MNKIPSAITGMFVPRLLPQLFFPYVQKLGNEAKWSAQVGEDGSRSRPIVQHCDLAHNAGAWNYRREFT